VSYVQSIVTILPRTAALLPGIILVWLGIINYVGTCLSSRVMATANLLKIAVWLRR
jgi:basic amino acid/polyamine antiporter, APA family